MKAKKKTNHFQADADKIEHIPEENIGHDKPIKAKKAKKNRFLACLRKTWVRIIGCMRCCTSIPEEMSAEELSGPSNNMGELSGHSESKMEELQSPCGMIMEELSTPIENNMEDNKAEYDHIHDQIQITEDPHIKDYDAEDEEQQDGGKLVPLTLEVVVTDNVMEAEYRLLEAEYPRLLEAEEYQHLQTEIHSQEDLHILKYTSQEEIIAEYDHIHDQIQITEDPHIKDYDAEDEEQQDGGKLVPLTLEVVVTDNVMEAEYRLLEAEYPRLLEAEEYQHLQTQIHSQEDLHILKYTSQEEIIAEYDHIHDQIQITEDPHIKDYDAEDEEQQDGGKLVPLTLEVVVTDNVMEAEYRLLEAKYPRLLEAEEYQHLQTQIHSQEDLHILKYTSQEEIIAEYDHIHDQIQVTEDPHIQDYDAEDEEQQDGGKLVPLTLEVVRTDNAMEAEYRLLEAKYQRLLEENQRLLEENQRLLEENQRLQTQIHSQEALHILKYTSQEEIPAEYDFIQDQIQITEDSHIQDYDAEDEEQDGIKPVPLTLECFTLHDKFGEGSFGEVLLATDKIRKEHVAIKVLHKSLFTDCKESFTELHILKQSHESPYLIHGLAAFHTEKCIYYVLELAPKGSLFDFITNNYPLDTPTIRFMMAELICGIQFLHSKNIIHRDLKPENITLTADYHIKITDFGLALMDVYERTTEEAKGTPHYMAPELWRKEEYGRGVDFFALGVIMYEMYVDELPFPENTLEELHYSILNHTPRYPESLTPDKVDILQGLLCKYQDYRLGELRDIRKHRFFSGINWEDVESRRMEPPEAMKMADYNYLHMDGTLDYMELQIDIEPEDQKLFKELSFVCPDWSQHYHPDYTSQEAEVLVTDNLMEAENHHLEAEYQRLLEEEEYQCLQTQINSQEYYHLINNEAIGTDAHYQQK